MILKIRDVNPEDWSAASILAQRFLKEFPDKFGRNDGCIYALEGNALYVYKTTNYLIIRGS